ncbi:MAG: hydrogenase nickel incorporation protein HypB [Lachnospiraceae bacterium]|nr:hydrogenase nickel incorporation protein HypB [Lachnospiraceae bacterium]
MKTITVNRSVTASNDLDADALRQELKEKGITLINLMSSPGSGKTTLLSRLITDLKSEINIAVMEADIDSNVDALKIESLGAKSIQVHTSGMCHMDAGMTRKSIEEMDTENVELAILENVGNLICPAEFDTGAHKNVMILSLPEGDDKPLKYPLMFEKSDVLVITKIDTKDYFKFDMDACKERVLKLNEDIKIFPVSAKTGEGMDALEGWIREILIKG